MMENPDTEEELCAYAREDEVREEDCIICKNQKTGDAERIARARAATTAHALAMKESEAGDSRFSFLELYGIYFPKIYTHEYKREHTMERERQEHILYFSGNGPICYYHSEFDDDFVLECYKKTEQEYAESAWKSS